MGDVTLLDAARRALRAPESPSPAPSPVGAGEAFPADGYPVRTPKEVLPHPKDLDCMASWDTETSGLHVDDGARTAIVSVAFCRKETPDTVESYAFPFDQGRAADKGFEIQRDKQGLPKGLTNPRVELPIWTADRNLGETEWRDLCRWLELAGQWVGLTPHNGKFDSHMTRIGTRHWEGVNLEPYIAWDTMLACPNLWPNQSIALKPTMARLFGAAEGEEAAAVREALITAKKLYGLTGDNGKRYDLIPWDIVGPYAAKDAEQTLRLAKHQAAMFWEGEGDWRDIGRANDLARVLFRMEWRGFGPLDVATATTVAEAIEKRIIQLENAMPYQPPTAYRAKEYFFDQLGLRPWKGAEEHREWSMVFDSKTGEKKRKLTKQGSLTIDILNRLADQGVPFAAEAAELSRIKTANNMQYRGYINLASPRDNRMRTSYKQAFVRSGRMSVERWQGQAIPRRDSIRLDRIPGMEKVPHPRDLMLVPECDCSACRGRQLRRVTMDLSQAELRVAFKLSNCKRGIEQIEDGRDIHGEMATQVFGVEKDRDPEEFKHYRYIAKRGVFGGIFMVGPKTFRDTVWKLAGIDLPFADAKKTVYGFRELYPEIEKEYNWSQNFVMQNGYVELADGTLSYFGPRDYDNTAWNRRVQGSLALFNAEWLIEVERRTAHQHDGRGALVLSIHDSVTLDLEPDGSDELLADIMAWTNRHFEDWFGIIGATDLDEGF